MSTCLASTLSWPISTSLPISTAAYRIGGPAETALRQGQWEKCRAVSRVLENGRRSRRDTLELARDMADVSVEECGLGHSCLLPKSCLTVLNGRSRYQQRLARDLVQLRTRHDQWENCLTGDGVEVGPWPIRPACLGLQASTLRIRPGRSRAGGSAVRLAGLSATNDVASPWRRRIGHKVRTEP